MRTFCLRQISHSLRGRKQGQTDLHLRAAAYCSFCSTCLWRYTPQKDHENGCRRKSRIASPKDQLGACYKSNRLWNWRNLRQMDTIWALKFEWTLCTAQIPMPCLPASHRLPRSLNKTNRSRGQVTFPWVYLTIIDLAHWKAINKEDHPFKITSTPLLVHFVV